MNNLTHSIQSQVSGHTWRSPVRKNLQLIPNTTWESASLTAILTPRSKISILTKTKKIARVANQYKHKTLTSHLKRDPANRQQKRKNVWVAPVVRVFTPKKSLCDSRGNKKRKKKVNWIRDRIWASLSYHWFQGSLPPSMKPATTKNPKKIYPVKSASSRRVTLLFLLPRFRRPRWWTSIRKVVLRVPRIVAKSLRQSMSWWSRQSWT